MSAPSKQLLWFNQSGHERFVDEPATVDRAVVDVVSTLVAPVSFPGEHHSGPFRRPTWVP